MVRTGACESDGVGMPVKGDGKTDFLTPVKEAAIIRLLERKTEGGDKFLISKSWWSAWEAYTGRGGAGSSAPIRPGPIDNSAIDENTEKIKNSEADCERPVLGASPERVSELVWRQLVGWYGGGPEFRQPGASPANTLIITVRIFLLGEKIEKSVLQLETEEKASELLRLVCREFNVMNREYYLYYPARKREVPSDDTTVGEFGLTDGSALCLLPKVSAAPEAGRMGLRNIGNTCYMNSSLQVLLHTPELMQYFLDGKFDADINMENPLGTKGEFAKSFAKLMIQAWEGGGNFGVIDPTFFWDTLTDKSCIFRSKDQHDTAELAEFVVDGLIEDCNRAPIPKPYRPEILDDQSKTDAEMAEECWDYHKSRMDSYITDKFHGQYRAETTCPACKFSSRRFESFAVLQLGLPQPAKKDVMFTLIDIAGEMVPTKFAVEIKTDATAKELCMKAAELIGEEDPEPWRRMSVAVKNYHGTVNSCALNEKLPAVEHFEELLVYRYPHREFGPCAGGQKTIIVHQKMTETLGYYYTSYKSTERKQAFGFPLVVYLTDDARCKLHKRRGRKRSPIEDLIEISLRPFKRPHTEDPESDNGSEVELEPVFENDERQQQDEEGSQASQSQSDTDAAPRSQNSGATTDDRDDDNAEDVNSDTKVVSGGNNENDNDDETQLINEGDGEGEEVSKSSDKDVSGSDAEKPARVDNETGVDDEGTGDANDADSNTAADGDVDEGESDPCLGSLFDDGTDDIYGPMPEYCHTPTVTDSPLRTLGAGPHDAYEIQEVEMDDVSEPRTVTVFWSKGADEYYNIGGFEKTAEDASHKEIKGRVRVHEFRIRECFDNDFAAHPLDEENLWCCGGCHDNVNGIKSMKLCRTPDVLLISLKRFEYYGQFDRMKKLSPLVKFPLEGLDLSEFCEGFENQQMYDLLGVCHHHGSHPRAGHYTSSVKLSDGNWWKFNDGSVMKTRKESIVTSDAYLLCYRRRGATVPDPQKIIEEYHKNKDRKKQQEAEEVCMELDDNLAVDELNMDFLERYGYSKRPGGGSKYGIVNVGQASGSSRGGWGGLSFSSANTNNHASDNHNNATANGWTWDCYDAEAENNNGLSSGFGRKVEGSTKSNGSDHENDDLIGNGVMNGGGGGGTIEYSGGWEDFWTPTPTTGAVVLYDASKAAQNLSNSNETGS